MTYLLDSNVWIEYLRGRNATIRERLRSIDRKQIVTCSVVLAEILYGARRSNNPAKNLEMVKTTFDLLVCLSFDALAAEQYAITRKQLDQGGGAIGPFDLQIAAIALVNGCTLVSHNTSEFSRVSGLRIEDWQMAE